MCSSPTNTPSEPHSVSPSPMSPDASTPPVAHTETLGPQAGPVMVPANVAPPLSASPATSGGSPQQTKRPRDYEDEDDAESRKRICLSPEPQACAYCGIPLTVEEELVNEKDKENCNTSASGPTPSVAAPPPGCSPVPNPGLPTAEPPIDSRPMCKSARSKPALAKESYKGVLRPQPFRRFPTAKNAERIALRNNLRDIHFAKKARPTNIRYARDAPPRRRPCGTHASNTAHRGPLSQPVPKEKYEYHFLPDQVARLNLPEVVDPALFLGTRQADSQDAGHGWAKIAPTSDDGLGPPPGTPLRAAGQGVYIPFFRLSSRLLWQLPMVHPSPMARNYWSTQLGAWRVMMRKRKEDARRAAKTGKVAKPRPASRRRGPDGKPVTLLPFPLVRSKLGMELWRWSAESSGGDEGGSSTTGVEG